jgi:hypothetical protein
MDLTSYKNQSFKSAREMLDRGDNGLLPHVALDLRKCIEAVVYQKLWARRDWIPEGAARRWQPPQAFDALIAVDPEAEHTSTIAISPTQNAPGGTVGPLVNMGTEVRPRSKWLKKTYNKLGSLLHTPWPFAEPTPLMTASEVRQYLVDTLREITPLVENTVTFAFANVVAFDCHSCKQVVKVNALACKHGASVCCLACGCRFTVEDKQDETIFHPDLAYIACKCTADIPIPVHKLSAGQRITCPDCNTSFEITEQVWQCRPV